MESQNLNFDILQASLGDNCGAYQKCIDNSVAEKEMFMFEKARDEEEKEDKIDTPKFGNNNFVEKFKFIFRNEHQRLKYM